MAATQAGASPSQASWSWTVPAANCHPDANTTSMHHHLLPQQASAPAGFTAQAVAGPRKMRKRKAEPIDNERLSKRLSLLNIEKNGQKLYVPVETPQPGPVAPAYSCRMPTTDVMQLDDTKHKVYIYNLDDELTDSDGGESGDDGKMVFLPDIEKHLRQNRIPPHVMANPYGELAGSNMQLVLYSDPTSLSVPEEHDSVRKAILDTRARLRQKQHDEQGNPRTVSSTMQMNVESADSMSVESADPMIVESADPMIVDTADSMYVESADWMNNGSANLISADTVAASRSRSPNGSDHIRRDPFLHLGPATMTHILGWTHPAQSDPDAMDID